MIRIVAVFLGLAMLGGAGPPATAGETTPQRLALPTALPEVFDVVVELDGEPRTLRLHRHSMRDSSFRVRRWSADGRTVEVAAPPPATYRGYLVGQPETEVVADLDAAGLDAWVVAEDGPAWTIASRTDDPRHDVRKLAGGGAWYVDGCPEQLMLPEFSGGVDPTAATPDPGSRGPVGQRRAQIAFDVDYEYYLLKGSSVAAGVAAVEAIMNQVDFFYARDVMITYTITDVIVRTSLFYSPTGGGDLLDQFRAEWNANQTGVVRDLAHLMTDKNNIEFGGLAWVGVVCTDSAYGWSLDGANIVGHEVGHNWGAGHCHDVSPCNNMCGACFWVAPKTKEIILAHRDSRTCLDPAGAYPAPLPPYAHPESTSMTRDELAAGAMRGFDVLANDHDGNLDPLTIDGFQTASDRGGVVTLSPGSGGGGRDELVYTASGEVFPGDDRFSYTVGDGTGLDATGEVTLRISAPSLAGYWKLDDGSGPVAADDSGGGRPGQVNGAAAWSAGVHGGALNFDGVDDFVAVPAPNREMQSATITAWMLRGGPQAPWAGIVFSRDGNTIAGLNFGGADELRYHWNGTASSYNWDSGLIVPDRRWVFVALVVEPGQATLYLHDGVTLLSAFNAVAHDPEEFDGEIQLGQDPGGGRLFAGLLDDVRIYDHALGAAEIAALHDLGGKAYAPHPPDGGKLLPSVGALGWGAGLGAESHDVYFGTDYVAVRDATHATPEYRGNLSATTFLPPGPLVEGAHYFWRVDEIQSGQIVAGDVWIFSIGPPAGHWKLDEAAGGVAVDAGGVYDGTYLGAPMLDQPSALPILGRSVDFDGVADSVRVPALGLNTDRVTLSAWVRREGNQSPFAGILFSRAGSTIAGLNLGDVNELRYHWNDGYWDWDSGLVLPDNAWVFVALVVEPSRATIYLGQGGVLTAASNPVNHGAEQFDGPLHFAQDPTGGRLFAGSLDDVRVYKHALSATDVEALYTSMGVGAGGLSGAPLRVDRLPGGDLELNWSPSCVGADVDYAIYEGSLGEFATHDAETCSTGSATAWTLTPGAGSRYFLVVPQSPNREGGYGADSAGNPRTQSVSACQPQYLAVCD